jgi:transcription elongation factor SPT4
MFEFDCSLGCCVQFRQNGCENYPFLEMDREHDNIINCTTPNFTR